MAESNAIMDYSNNGHYSTAAKAADVLAVWEANKDSAYPMRVDHGWSGDTTVATSTPLSGWDGMFKMLQLNDCPHDPSYSLPECTPAHTMLRNIKTMFNLPNQGTDSDWKDDYPTHFWENYDNGEFAYYNWVSKDIASVPMMLSKPSMVTADTPNIAWPSGMPTGAGNNSKCLLKIGLQGWDLDVGVDRSMSWTVRPNDTNITNYNSHYKALADADTLAADYTDPPLTGEEYTVGGNILLINCENQQRPTTLNSDTDRVALCIAWTSHTYAQIKALIDAAVVTP